MNLAGEQDQGIIERIHKSLHDFGPVAFPLFLVVLAHVHLRRLALRMLVCPISHVNPDYLGPAALAKAHRFLSDSRLSDTDREEIVERVVKGNGVPACEKYLVCNRVCPKNVQPGTSIREIRKGWMDK